MRQPLGGTGTRSAGACRPGPPQAGERARQRADRVGRLDVARRGEDQVLADELPPEMRDDLVDVQRVQGRRVPSGELAVRVVAVQVAREEARAQRLVVVAGLVDLGGDLAPRPRQLDAAS